MNVHTTTGESARRLDAQGLDEALRAARADTLATFAACQAALGTTPLVPQHGQFNPPLWELGHIGWFQEFWLSRNPQRALAEAADADAPRFDGVRGGADALYDSSHVPHATRWTLPLPDADATRADLAQQLESSLALLPASGGDDAALYFHRLALFHEDMHHEAALYMAQALDVPISDARWQPLPPPVARRDLVQPAGPWCLGHDDAGFAFDNERMAHEVVLGETRIDSRVVTWAEYLPFVDSGAAPRVPRYLRRQGTHWQQRRHGQWLPLDSNLAACHLSLAEARAWCAWAGRRLPSEAEWHRAAMTEQDFAWGQVWEWTASRFDAFAGFQPHAYRDYSAPWFGSRQVLKGASFGTQPRMHHRHYRNFFTPDRDDIFAGFRSCAL